MSFPVVIPMKALLVNGMHRFASLWTIERKDGVIYRFTDHNATITKSGLTYTPLNGVLASARQKKEGNHPQNLEVIGVISDSSILHADLAAGRFRGAKVTEMVVDWQYPEQGEFQKAVMWITDTSFTNETWDAQVAGLANRLKRMFGDVVTKSCRWDEHGDADCGVNLADFTLTGTVSVVQVPRRGFTSSQNTKPDNWFMFGLLTWTSGLNNGLKMEVRGYLKQNGIFALQLEMPYDIAPGDAFSVYAGCNRTFNNCKDKFNNVPNFGGRPDVPGTDKMIRTPDSKV